MSAKLAKVEERLTKLQNEIRELTAYLSASREARPLTQRLSYGQRSRAAQVRENRGPPVIFHPKKVRTFHLFSNQNRRVFAAALFLALLAASLFLLYTPTLKADTTIQISITFEPFDATLHYKLQAGDRYTAPAQIDAWQKTWAFTKWADGMTERTRTFLENGAYTIVYDQSIYRSHGVISIAFDDGTHDQLDYAYPLMRDREVHGTFYVISDCLIEKVPFWMCGTDYMNVNEALQLQADGNEIASHSRDHSNFDDLADQQVRDQCQQSKETLESFGLRIENFAYPYGSTNPYIDSIAKQYYRSVRHGVKGDMQLPYTNFKVYGMSVEDNVWKAINEIDRVYETNSWSILYFHHVAPVALNEFSTSTKVFAQCLDYALNKGVTILTVKEVLDLSSLLMSVDQ